MKAAIAIFNARTTGSNHAALLQTLSGRESPVLSDTISKLLPSPATIAGPTLATTINVSRIDWNEKASDLLRRLATEQRTLLRQQHVPPDFAMHLSTEDQKVLQLATRQAFHFQPLEMSERNYSTSTDPTMKLLLDIDFKVNRPLGSGFVWECGFNDPEHLRSRVWYNLALFSERQVASVVTAMLNVAAWLCEVENWEQSVQEAKSRLGMSDGGAKQATNQE